jgi:hypothetical protein
MREKILRSLNSSDLTQEEWESAAHVVASLGAAQIGCRKHLSIGAMLLHVRGGQARFLPRVVALTTLYVASRAARDRWAGITKERARVVAVEAIDRYLNPNCLACNGVGKLGEPGQVIVLCSRKHGGCGGTGKKPETWTGWKERIKDVISVLGAWEGYASGGTRKQAGRLTTRYGG